MSASGIRVSDASIFIATAAFKGDELASIKLFALVASVLAAMLGMGILALAGNRQTVLTSPVAT